LILTRSITELRENEHSWRRAGESIGFVPTMGNLHTGHMALIMQARAECNRVVSSIFVNPSQFGESEDLSNYPRSPKEDEALLEPHCDLLFLPQVETIYPGGVCLTNINIPGYTSELCGANRPGHFVGVLTVVNLLFNLTQPDRAYFGLKDYQQYRLIQRMAADLHCPVEIIGVDTGRDDDGLALSSRNQYLSREERAKAPLLYQTLVRTVEKLDELDEATLLASHRQVCAQASEQLTRAGFRVDYFTLRDSDTLQPPTPTSVSCRLLAAAWLGKARLIDNISLKESK